jgi:hypothetical protein
MVRVSMWVFKSPKYSKVSYFPDVKGTVQRDLSVVKSGINR